mgnify:CR=1 FL=1
MKSFLTILAVLVHQIAIAQTEVNIEAHLLDHLEKYIPEDIENEVDSALWQKKLTMCL